MSEEIKKLPVAERVGKKMGMAIKEIEKKWIDNNFSLNNDELNKLINQFK